VLWWRVWSRIWGGRAFATWLPAGYRAALGVAGVETPVVVANMRWETAISTEIARDLLYYTMGDVDIF
jgi:hypothetical protein